MRNTRNSAMLLTYLAVAGGVCALPRAGLLAAQPGQITLERVERMPNLPRPFRLLDFRARAKAFDRLVFDAKAAGPYRPIVRWLATPLNLPPGPDGKAPAVFALPSYLGASPVEPDGRPFRGEAITGMGALLGATLVGIDKSPAGARDSLRTAGEFFQRRSGANVFMNRCEPRHMEGSFWYATLPNVQAFCLADRYPRRGDLLEAVRKAAGQYQRAALALTKGTGRADFDHTDFDFRTTRPFDNGRWREPDAAAAVAWLLYMAHQRWPDPRRLAAAEACMQFLRQRTPEEGNPLYEVLLCLGPVVAARMNAELGRRYDVAKLMRWCLGDGAGPHARPGWGVICQRWGQTDCHGLIGSTGPEPYAFAMNTFLFAGFLAPLPRYDPRWARTIGKWMLNLANSARLFYGDCLPDDSQSCPFVPMELRRAIAYEGLRKAGRGIARTAGETTVRGQSTPGGHRAMWEPGKAQTLAADPAGVLEHVWRLDLPEGVQEAWLHLEARRELRKGVYRFTWSLRPTGPWRAVLDFDDRWGKNAREGGFHPAWHLLKALGGASRVYLRVEAVGAGPLAVRKLRLTFARGGSPFACGDPIVHQWGPPTDLGLYGGGAVGLLGAVVSGTNHEHILRVDCLATDFFRRLAYPTYLYFNPYPRAKAVSLAVGPAERDVYEATTDSFLLRRARGDVTVRIPADTAYVVVLAPAGGEVVRRGRARRIGGVMVGYHSP